MNNRQGSPQTRNLLVCLFLFIVTAILLSPSTSPEAQNGRYQLIVTGGAGYVGSHAVKLLCDMGYTVNVIDNLENGHMGAVDVRATFTKLDTANRRALIDHFKKVRPDAVLDFAAYLDVGESQREPERYVANNLKNFLNVMHAMAESGCERLVKSSTQATYGDAEERYMPLKEEYSQEFKRSGTDLARGKVGGSEVSGEALHEYLLRRYNDLVVNEKDHGWLSLDEGEKASLLVPHSVYGWTKLLNEIIMEKYRLHRGVGWVALRYGNVCGADPSGSIGESKRRPHTLMTLAFYHVLGWNPEKLKMFGTDYPTRDGTTIRDYVHPTDLAYGHIAALKKLLESPNVGRVYNLGTGEGSTVLEVLAAVERASGRKVKYTTHPRRVGDTTSSRLSIDRASRELGFIPKYSLSDMARTAWEWHSKWHDREHYRRLPPSTKQSNEN